MKPSLRTIITSLVAIAIFGGLAFIGFRTDPVPVDLHTVDRGPLEVLINADGVTRIREIYEVAAPVTGTARRSPVRVGDAVTAGETVVAVVQPAASPILDARSRAEAEAVLHEAIAALAASDADIMAAREELNYAESNHSRILRLVDRGIASIAALEDSGRQLASAEAAHDAALSRREMAAGGVDRARATLDEPTLSDATSCCMELRAPATGVVLSIDTISARPVQSGARLLTIGDPSDLEIVADLLSADAVRLPADAAARVERWGGEDALDATLRQVEPIAREEVSALGIEEQRADAIFDLTSPLADRAGLGEGYAVFLRIIRWRTEDALRIPISATFRHDDGWATFVAVDGTAKLRPIALGRMGELLAEVTGGLDAGEDVVLHPSDKVGDDVPIVARAE